MHRLFFALWPDDALRDGIARIAAALRAQGGPRIRPVRRERLHLTLRFLGDVAELSPERLGALDAVASAAAEACGAIPGFDLDRAGDFQRGRVWWLGCTAAVPELQRLHASLSAAGGQAPEGSAFVPHVTIARQAGCSLDEAIGPLHWAPREFVLVDSRPGAGYEVLRRWPLPG